MQMALQSVPMHLESTSQRHYRKVLNISRLISLFIPSSAILEPWNRSYADVQEALMLEIISLNFPSSKKVTISPAYMKDSFTEHRLLSFVGFFLVASLLLSPSSYYSPHNRPISEETRCWGKK